MAYDKYNPGRIFKKQNVVMAEKRFLTKIDSSKQKMYLVGCAVMILIQLCKDFC